MTAIRSIRDVPVAVVGGAGFLGSHLVNELIDNRQCRVVVIDNLCAGRREFVHKDAIFEYADITGSETHLRNLFQNHGTQFVFNYAAWPYVPDCYDRPLRVFEVNATGAMQVINAAQEAGVRGILQVSSAEIYGDYVGEISGMYGVTRTTEQSKINENELVRPRSTYGVAKAAVDSYVQTSWKERKAPCIALRQFNTLGERESHPYIVPEIISQLSRQTGELSAEEFYRQGGTAKGITLHLGNNSSRDFIYAGDAVRMAVELLESGQFGEVYNLGSEQSVKIYGLAQKIAGLMGLRTVEIQQDPARIRKWEIWYLKSDNTKIYQAIQTRPQVSLEEALIRTVDYYRSVGSKWCWE